MYDSQNKFVEEITEVTELELEEVNGGFKCPHDGAAGQDQEPCDLA